MILIVGIIPAHILTSEVAGGCSEQNSRDSFQAAEDHGLGVEGGECDCAGRAGGRQGGHGCPGQLDLLG